MNSREALYVRLVGLLEAQFEEVVFRAEVPTRYLEAGALARRAQQVITWAEQSPGNMTRVGEALLTVLAPPSSYSCIVDPPHLPWRPEFGPGSLLRAEYAIVPFAGRHAELTDMLAWADGEDALRIRLYTGEGGFGKTRLAIEACRRLRARGVEAGFLPRGEPLRGDPGAASPRLTCVVLDYAESRPEEVAQLVKTALGGHGGRLRLVLLSRDAGEWWRVLRSRHEGVGDVLRSASVIAVGALAMSEADRLQQFTSASHAFAAKLGRAVATMPSPPGKGLSAGYFERVLLLHMRALMAVGGNDSTDEAGILDWVLDRECRFWGDVLRARQLAPHLTEGLELAMAAITLVQGAQDLEEAVSVVGALPFFQDENRSVLETVAGVLHECYGGRMWIEPLQPDLLGEQLVRRAMGARGVRYFAGCFTQ